MKTKSRKQMILNVVRLVAIIAAALALLMAIAAIVINQTESAHRRRTYQERDASQQQIVRYLEFNGLDDTAKNMMQTHAHTYTDYSNFVVIDSAFNVLHSTNQGYLDGSGKFFGLLYTQEYTNYGVVCAEDGNILSIHALSEEFTALRQLTNSSTVKPKRIGEGSAAEAEQAAVPGGRYGDTGEISISDYYGGYSYQHQMYFAPIAAKGMYLYFLYDSDTPKWDGGQGIDSRIYSILAAIGIGAFLLYWMALAVWVFMDAQKRDNHPALWGVLTLFTNFVGLIVYMVTRPDAIACKVCREPLEKRFSYCPYCGARNRAKCETCGELITPGWSNCPYCGTPVPPEEEAAIIAEGSIPADPAQ